MNHLSQNAVRLEAHDIVRSHRAWLESLLLVLLLSVWFGYELGTRALWSPDEGRYAEIPREMVASGDYVTPRLNGVKYFEKPPLVYWLTAGSIRLFGLNEWALRLWPALFALLGCLTVYFLGRRLFDSRTGLFAAVVLACSPLYDFMGGTLTLDMPVTALLTLALSAFLLGARAPPGQGRPWFYLFYISVALSVLSKGLIGIVIPALVIGPWIVILGEWRLLREIHLPAGMVIVVAIAAPWHVLVSQANPEFARFYFIHEHFARYLTTVHQRYQPAWYFLPVLLGGMYPWSALMPVAFREMFTGLWRERRQRRESWFLLLWAMVPFVFFSLSSSKLVPYILPVFPPLALLLGRWLSRAWKRRASLVLEAMLLLILGATMAAVLLLLPRWMAAGHVSVITAAAELGWALYAMAAALLLAGVLPVLAWYRGGARAAILSLAIGAVVLVGTFDLTFSRLDVGRSVKDLALSLNLGPDDEVMTYEVYYQDLPVYLERHITIVNWTGELAFGARAEDTHTWMIDARAFRQRWREPRRIYLFTSQANYAKFLADPPGPLCLIRSTPHAVVIVNRECRT